jgi:DNA-binding transcriptional LysR family regulator
VELRHLRAFTAVAEELHFGRAAHRLHVAQPALSQQVKQLEQDVGAVLLERTTRQVRLTSAGAVFLEHAHRVLQEAERARESVLVTERGERGELRVGVTGVITWRLLPRMARAYRRRYPHVRLELRPSVFSAAQVSALIDGQIDVGFLRAPVPAGPLASRVILNESLMAVLPQDHPLAGEPEVHLVDLADDAFVSYVSMQGSALRDAAVHACFSAGFTPRVVQEAPDTHTVVALVGAAVGVALMPASAETLQIEGVVFTPIAGGVDVRVPIALAWREGDTSPVLAGFLATAEEVLPSPAPGSGGR